MKETFLYTKGEDYELFVQVTNYTHYYDVLTIVHYDEKWKEDKTQYSEEEYGRLQFPKTYQIINEIDFEKAQNEILKTIGKTRSHLKNLYHQLWHLFLVDRLRIEEMLIESGIDLTNHWLVSQFRQEMEWELELHKKRQTIHTVFNQNNPEILSNEDIFNKVSSNILENYLERRTVILSKIKKK